MTKLRALVAASALTTLALTIGGQALGLLPPWLKPHW